MNNEKSKLQLCSAQKKDSRNKSNDIVSHYVGVCIRTKTIINLTWSLSLPLSSDGWIKKQAKRQLDEAKKKIVRYVSKREIAISSQVYSMCEYFKFFFLRAQMYVKIAMRQMRWARPTLSRLLVKETIRRDRHSFHVAYKPQKYEKGKCNENDTFVSIGKRVI